MAAREAEINRNQAAQRRAWLESAPARKVGHPTAVRLAKPPGRVEDDFIDIRLKELEERERALADREELIAKLEALLEHSRRRLEERLEQLAKRRAAVTPTPPS